MPFIKYLYEEREPHFLDVYRMESFRSPVLIWSSEMRRHLEQTIQLNAKEFQERLYSKSDRTEPFSLEMMKDIVEYREIDRETRCGRYYLSVWVEQGKLRNDP